MATADRVCTKTLHINVSFCGLIKEISRKMCILCVRVQINKRSFQPFCVGIYALASLFLARQRSLSAIVLQRQASI